MQYIHKTKTEGVGGVIGGMAAQPKIKLPSFGSNPALKMKFGRNDDD